MLGLLTKLSEQEKIITSSKQQLCKLRVENLNLKSRISKLEEKLSSIDESLENSSIYVQDQKQSQHHPNSTHPNSFQIQSESRLIVNNETENVQLCNNNSSTKNPVASEFLSPNNTPDKLNPISIVQSFGPKQHNEPKKRNTLNIKRIDSLPLI